MHANRHAAMDIPGCAFLPGDKDLFATRLSFGFPTSEEDLARVPDSARRTSTPLPSYGLTTARAFVHDSVDHPRPLILEAETYKSGQPASFRIKFSGEEYEPILDAISSIGTRMLEYGMPFTQLSKALKGITFKPHEISRDFEGEDRIKSRSILDYSGKWLEHSFGKNFT